MATEPFNCRIFGHFREGIASWRSLLQGGYLKQKIEIIGELNVSGNGNQQSVVSKTCDESHDYKRVYYRCQSLPFFQGDLTQFTEDSRRIFRVRRAVGL